MKRKLLFTNLFVFFTLGVFGQMTNSTVPPLAGGNGSAGCTFNLTVNAPISLTEIGQSFTTASQTYEIWYSPTAINGTPNISAGGGWTMLQTGSITGLSPNNTTPVISSIPLNTPLVLAPGTYGFYIGGSNVVYTTYSSGQSAYSDAFTTIETGTNVGYGGTTPTPTNHPRQFNGSVTYVPVSSVSDDIAIGSIITPGFFCGGASDSLTISVSNFGTTQIDSFKVVWDINSTLDSTWVFVPLDTFGGSGSNSATINVANIIMPMGTADITVWTKSPNGNTDGDQTNDTTSVSLNPSMNGTYIIDGSGAGDYLTFTDAVNDLVLNGVCGPVELAAVDGVYNEQVTIPEILGASSINTITLKSQSGNNTNTVLTYNAVGTTDNWVVYLDGGDYITIKNLRLESTGTTYGRVIVMDNGANYNTIDSCFIKGDQGIASTSTNMVLLYSTSGDADSYNTITNNAFLNGSYGTYFYGGSSTNLAQGNVIENNWFLDQYYIGIRYYYQDALVLRNNYVNLSGNYTTGSNYGIYLGYCDNASDISSNRIVVSQRGYGMYLTLCDGTMVNRGRIFNNSVTTGDSTTTSLVYGIYLTSTDFHDIEFNSVNVVGTSTTTRGLYIAGTDNEVYSNNIVNNGTAGYAAYYSSGVDASDYNNFFAPNTDLVYSGAAYTTLADLQTNTGFDLNSYSVDPMYTAWDTLNTCADELNNTARPNAMITEDLDGEIRGVLPDIGAHEFEGVANFYIGADTSLCNNQTITIGDSNSTSVWNWSTGANTNTITLSGADAGVIGVERTSECGTTQDTIVITNIPDPVAGFTWSSSYVTGIFTNTSTGADSYLWDFGDGSTSTLENPLHVYSWKGDFVVTLTVTGECGTAVFTDTINLDVVGVDENELVEFNLYPNPTNGEVTITFNQTLQNASLDFIDATGRILLSKEITSNQMNFSVSQFENGVYFVKVNGAGFTRTSRLVKK
ncbi:MAG: T9SS type A sorting domain-containing protein [Crocinitomicaceae bacterium]|nr:T9SS type A sorting domain-containing protein [Crocinitomicaceae bacterium]